MTTGVPCIIHKSLPVLTPTSDRVWTFVPDGPLIEEQTGRPWTPRGRRRHRKGSTFTLPVRSLTPGLHRPVNRTATVVLWWPCLTLATDGKKVLAGTRAPWRLRRVLTDALTDSQCPVVPGLRPQRPPLSLRGFAAPPPTRTHAGPPSSPRDTTTSLFLLVFPSDPSPT